MPLPILALVAAGTAVAGAAKASKGANEKKQGQRDAEAARKKRKSYRTPAEIYKALNAAEYNAQTGFDSATMNYLTSQTDNAFSSSIDTAKFLGADPNDLSAIFSDKINSIMSISAQDHVQRTQNFSQYLSALGTLAQSKSAEWSSEQNLIKDDQQTAQAKIAAGAQEQANGTNMIISAASSMGKGNLYKMPNANFAQQKMFKNEYGDVDGKAAYKYANKNGLSFSEYTDIYNDLPDFSKLKTN